MDLYLAGAFSVVAAVVAAGVSPWFTSRAMRAVEVRQRRSVASQDLASPLRDLRTLLRRRGYVVVSSLEVSEAIRSWLQAWDRQRHLIPEEFGSAGPSVRDAMGEVFGAVALAQIRPDLAEYPLAEPDAMWQDFGASYIDYVLDALVQWGDSTPSVPKRILTFDKWLVSTRPYDPIRSCPRRPTGPLQPRSEALRAANPTKVP